MNAIFHWHYISIWSLITLYYRNVMLVTSSLCNNAILTPEDLLISETGREK